MKELIRPALALLWSIASIVTYLGTGNIPEWMLVTMGTCVGWFFISTEKEKIDAKKALRDALEKNRR